MSSNPWICDCFKGKKTGYKYKKKINQKKQDFPASPEQMIQPVYPGKQNKENLKYEHSKSTKFPNEAMNENYISSGIIIEEENLMSNPKAKQPKLINNDNYQKQVEIQKEATKEGSDSAGISNKEKNSKSKPKDKHLGDFLPCLQEEKSSSKLHEKLLEPDILIEETETAAKNLEKPTEEGFQTDAKNLKMKEEDSENKNVKIVEEEKENKGNEEHKKLKKPLVLLSEFDRDIGLVNIGNTCYMNSVIQVLARIPEFGVSIKLAVSSLLLKSLDNLINVLLSPTSNVEDTESYLIDFKNIISKKYDMFRGTSENDAKEIFIIITNEADEFNSTSKQFSLIKEQKFTCDKGHQSYNSDENNFLIVPKEKKEDLQDFINNIKTSKTFAKNNQLFCEECQKMTDSEVEIVNIGWPNILSFYLSASQISQSPPEKIEAGEFEYIIFGAICYYGDHFIAFVKDYDRCLWKRFNDAFVDWYDPDWYYLYLVFYRKIN